MSDNKRSQEFTEGKARLDEICRRLGGPPGTTEAAAVEAGGLPGGLGNSIPQLGLLAEQSGDRITGTLRRGNDGAGVEVHEIRVPMIDIVNETDRVSVVAELPGIR